MLASSLRDKRAVGHRTAYPTTALRHDHELHQWILLPTRKGLLQWVEPDLASLPPDVGVDDAAVCQLLAERDSTDDTTGEDRPHRADGSGRRLGGVAPPLLCMTRSGQAWPCSRSRPFERAERAEIVAQTGTDLGAHHRGGAAGELPDPRAPQRKVRRTYPGRSRGRSRGSAARGPGSLKDHVPPTSTPMTKP